MPQPSLRPILLLFALFPAAAAAEIPMNAVSDELGLATARSTSQTPSIGQTSEALYGNIDLGDGVSLDLAGSVSFIGSTPAVAGQQFGSRGGTVWDFGSGISYEASDQVMLGLSLDWSPSAKLLTDTRISYASAAGVQSADALLSSVTSSVGALLSFGYDTAGDSDLETAVDADLGLTHYDTDQRIPAVRGPNGEVVTAAQLRDYCLANPTRCSRQLLGLLRQQPAALTQVEARLGLTETLWEDTDVGISGSWFFYDRDPTDLGFFGLVSAGHPMASLGGGPPLAPYRWRIRPEMGRRFGDLSARIWVEHGEYVSGEGHGNGVGARIQLRLTRAFRVWLTGRIERDVDASGNTASFDQLALGVMVLF